MPTKRSSSKSKKGFQTPGTDPLETLIRRYLDQFITENRAAGVVAAGLRVLGIGIRPLVDHLLFRTLDIDKRAREFLKLGYVCESELKPGENSFGKVKVYSKQGFPKILIEQPFQASDKKSQIADWIRAFGEEKLHHVAICVDDIENAIFYLEKQGVPFSGGIGGDKGTDLRNVFTAPEMKSGKAYSSVELTERHRGYFGFGMPC